MSETGKRRRKAVAAGVVGLCALMGVAATGLVIGVGIGGSGDGPVASGPGSTDLAAKATAAMAGAGYGFATAALEGGVMRITGDAPNGEVRERGFTVGRDAVLADPSHSGTVRGFANAISVSGQPVDAIVDAASTLGTDPDADSCQTAYDTTLEGEVVNFESGSAVVSATSFALLDGLAAVAQRCVSYRVEIGGHTDARGDDGANQALSERRAQAVADYLVGKGVSASQLGVVGYGESEPLDASGTAEADAMNRRIAFKVEARP
jgi:outer membrane protein OmpA-like peptidoglycan-associated protein